MSTIIIPPNTNDIANNMYNSLKSLMNDTLKSGNHTTTVLKILTIVCTNIEKVKVNNKILQSSEKKDVAVRLGKLLINDLYKNDDSLEEINCIYDLTADKTIDLIIGFSNDMYPHIKNCLTNCFKR